MFSLWRQICRQTEKRNGEWKIAHRQVVMDWNHNEISSGIFDEGMFKTLT